MTRRASSCLPSVCKVASSYPRSPGDRAGTFIRSLAEAIARRGHPVRVLVPDSGQRADVDPSSLVPVHRFPYAPTNRLRMLGYGQSLVADRRLKRAAYFLIGPYLVSGVLSTLQLARKHDLDVLHGHWVLPNGPIVAIAARLLGKPYVISLHGSDVYLAERHPAFAAVARWVLRHSALTTACSQDLAVRALGLGAPPETVEVVSWGVDPALFCDREEGARRMRHKLGIHSDASVLLALGRLVFKKGFDYLLRAMPSIAADRPDVRLVVAGDGDCLEQLKSLAGELGIADHVLFPGVVDWREVPDLMATADLFVLPSIRDDSGNVDGQPVVLLEAMAAARAIVATDVGGVTAVVSHGESGLIVPERSPEALAAAIKRLLADSELRQCLGASGRRRVQRELNWDNVASKFGEAYDDARRGTRSRRAER